MKRKFNINVRVRNFGQPSTILLSRTSSNKGPLVGPVRHEGVLVGLSGAPGTQAHISIEHKHLFNRSAPGASVWTWAHRYASGLLNRKLETHKHFVNRRAPGATNLRNLCTVYPFHLCFGMPHNSLHSKIFLLKIFSWTFLLILLGSRRDLI
jgi:hypothetical protein